VADTGRIDALSRGSTGAAPVTPIPKARTVTPRTRAYRGIAGMMFDAFIVISPDGTVIDAVDVEWLGYNTADAVGMNAVELLHPDDVERALTALGRELAGVDTHRSGSLLVRVQRADGLWSTVEMLGSARLDDPDIGGVLVMLRDVTGRPVADRVLAVSEYLYRGLGTTAMEFTVIVDENGAPLHYSPSLTAVLGWQASELLSMDPMSIVHPDDHLRLRAEVSNALQAANGVRRADIRCMRPDGSHLWVDTTIANLLEDPVVAGVVFHARNIDERRRAADRLFHLALHDPLTGLPNRAHFAEHLDALLSEPAVSSVTVLFCDLVGFKAVNDRLGHLAGDELLRYVAQRLRRAVRPGDLVARVGGDEFCTVCTDIDSSHAMELAERIVHAFADPIALEGVSVAVGISVGVAHAPGGSRSADLMRRADAAMYRAKAKGRNALELATDWATAETPELD
jgi:diguanylate cyclase (GGDEF)-like protein/PAS domain S-box-containing protein